MATSTSTYFAPSWGDMSKEEKQDWKEDGGTKQTYNEAHGLGKYKNTTPEIENYDRTGYGSGSEKDIDKLSRADLLNLEAQGYDRQEIIDYSADAVASGSRQGEMAQSLLDSWIRELNEKPEEPEETDTTEGPIDSTDPVDPVEPVTEIIDNDDNDNNDNTGGGGGTDGPGSGGTGGTTTVTTGGGDVTGVIGSVVGDGSVVSVGDGNAGVGGNNTVSNNFNQDKEFRFDSGGGDVYNYGNMNSDLSTNLNNVNMFNATAGGSSSDSNDFLDGPLQAALNFNAAGQAGLIPAGASGISATAGDFSDLIPKPSNIALGAHGLVESNIARTQALGDLHMNNLFGPRWPLFGYS